MAKQSWSEQEALAGFCCKCGVRQFTRRHPEDHRWQCKGISPIKSTSHHLGIIWASKNPSGRASRAQRFLLNNKRISLPHGRRNSFAAPRFMGPQQQCFPILNLMAPKGCLPAIRFFNLNKDLAGQSDLQCKLNSKIGAPGAQ